MSSDTYGTIDRAPSSGDKIEVPLGKTGSLKVADNIGALLTARDNLRGLGRDAARKYYEVAEADRLAALRSNAKVKSWAQKNGYSVVDGEVSPRAVTEYLRSQTKKAVAATKRLFKDAEVEVKDRDWDAEIDEITPPEASAAKEGPAFARSVSGGTNSITLSSKDAGPVENFAISIANGGVKSQTDFLRGLNKALGSTESNVDKSQYYTTRTEDGLHSLRVANHRGNANNFELNGNTADTKTGIVIKMSDKPFVGSNKVDYTEYIYFPDKIDVKKQEAIARGIAEWVKTGKYNGPTPDQIKKTNATPPLKLHNGDGRVVGTFDPATKKVTLYRGADERTVYHELVGHGVEDWARRNNTALHGKLTELARTAPQELIDDVRSRYPDADEATITKEIIARIAEGKGLENIRLKDAPKTWYAKAYVAVKDALVGFMEKIGLNRIDLSKTDDMTPSEAMDYLMREIGKGKTLGEIGTADAQGKMTRAEPRHIHSDIFTGVRPSPSEQIKMQVGNRLKYK